MALEDLFMVAETISRIIPKTGVNVSYYMVLAGLMILLILSSFILVTIATRSIFTIFRKPPSFIVKAILLVGVALLILGVILP
ncbi:MAG: LPXTG cell wall anchor domain-containing protein [Acidilobaceae archaeon]